MSDRFQPRCSVCRGRVPSTSLFWSSVSPTGDVKYWHAECDESHAKRIKAFADAKKATTPKSRKKKAS